MCSSDLAYKDLYEFVSYGLTNEEFSKALSKQSIPADESYTKTASLWERFVKAVASLIGFTSQDIEAVGQKLGIAPEDVTKEQLRKEYGTESERLARAGLTQNAMTTEMFAAFQDIVAPPPAAGIEMEPLGVQEVKQAGPVAPETDEQILERAKEEAKIRDRGLAKNIKNLFTKRGAYAATKNFQNERYALKRWEDYLSLIEKIIRTSDKLNNVYGQITRSGSMGVNLYNTHMKFLVQDAQKALQTYADKLGIDIKEALTRIHLIRESRHEPERRRAKFVLYVPLEDLDTQKIKIEELFEIGRAHV